MIGGDPVRSASTARYYTCIHHSTVVSLSIVVVTDTHA